MTLGRVAYEAGKSGPLGWDQLQGQAREHWERVAQAVGREVQTRLALSYAEAVAHERAQLETLAESGQTSPSQVWR